MLIRFADMPRYYFAFRLFFFDARSFFALILSIYAAAMLTPRLRRFICHAAIKMLFSIFFADVHTCPRTYVTYVDIRYLILLRRYAVALPLMLLQCYAMLAWLLCRHVARHCRCRRRFHTRAVTRALRARH